MKWPYWQRTEGSKGSMLAKDSDSWGCRKMQAGCLQWTRERGGGREERGRGNCVWKYSSQRYWNSEAKIHAHKSLGLQQVISEMINIFTVLGDFSPWKMSLSLIEYSSGNKVTRCFMGQTSKQWRKNSWNYFRYSWSRIWWGRGAGGGTGGVWGGCFTDYDSDECQLTIKHTYRRDCLDSPMCILNIKNLQGVNKCFMWNWKRDRRKDKAPLTQGSKPLDEETKPNTGLQNEMW